MFGTPEGSEARAALQLLLDASAETFSPVVTLATMRSDFLNAFRLFEGAAKRYEEVTLDPMLRSHFSEVIEGPAACFGLDLDPGLAERIKEDAAYADALPLLAYTLKRLFDQYGADGKLERSGYEKLFPPVAVHGSLTKVRGVSAAIKITADEILGEKGYAKNGKPLADEDPRMRDLRRAFYSLAQVGEEHQFTRRIARWSQMPPSCEEVLQRFVKERLLVSGATQVKVEEGGEQEKTEPTLSVAHEALFRVWDTLNGWLRQDRKALALRSQIKEAAREWHEQGRLASRAWSEERILDAARVIEDSGVSLADIESRATVDAFLGPTDREQLEILPALNQAEDETAGSGRYGEAWRLPLSHEARASVGVRLAILGDRRKGVGLQDDGLPHIDWVPIEGGEVTIEIRANPADPHSAVDKLPPRTVAPFWMARFPVTIAQFQAFLAACYQDGSWRVPWFNLPASYSPPKPRARHGNHPVDTVNWYDSVAFCHWVSSRFEYEVRLPTEYEWQLAATGGDTGRIYPWGAEWDPAEEPWRANTLESELGRSTAVGMYPAGASPAGIEDMVGTTWEWCLNAFDDPDNTAFPASQEENRRVLRGGSWGDDQVDARSAVRNGLNPLNRLNIIGFRVVCSSPS